MIKTYEEFKEYIKEDEKVNFGRELKFKEKIFNDKFLLLLLRYSHYLMYKTNKNLFDKIKLMFSLKLYNYYKKKFNIEIKPKVCIGKGFRIPHPIGIVINSNAKIGDYFTCLQNVTIGNKNSIDDVAEIGNNVFIGAGAVVIGKVKIGNNVKIGANAVVLKDIPDNNTAVGIPAKIKEK
jgi:serine O-acetyltransferase